ncbi:MAG: pyruvate oxidase [Planctomycetaceae bacterium]|nr:pyruvate oxidase [Planctomycetaceae bacterium]
MSKSIQAAVAMLNILESWGVDHIYGIPGGSINSTMDGLYQKRDTLRYIQVRHEECGALAAAFDAKSTGKVGVCFGSAGPGATHLFNGLYDAQMDKVPVLALVGQVASTAMNFDTFQELNENPMFADVSVYNRTAMSPSSLPHLVDEGIRRAYEHKGVAVITIPVDFGMEMIEEDDTVSAASSHRQGVPLPDPCDIREAVRLIEHAKRPVLYVGQGARGGKDEILALSRHYSLPIVLSVLAKGIVPDSEENLMGFAARVATKPANEALALSDLIIFVGSDFPFAKSFFPKTSRMIQVDIDSSKLGRRHFTDVAILGDARETMRQMKSGGEAVRDRPFLNACRLNMRNWKKYLAKLANADDRPLRPEPVFKEINRIAASDAIFITDIGNTTIHVIRNIDMNGRGHQFATSGWFATMGAGVPGAIAAKLNYPNRQVFNLSGDGAFSMVMQDIITQVRYGLPIINVVFSNESLGFIDAEQEDTGQTKFGVDLTGADYAKMGEAMGARGFRVDRPEQLHAVFDAARDSRVPVVIDIKVDNQRPFPAEAMVLDPEKHSKEDIEAFKKRYDVDDMPVLRELLEDHS